MEEIWIFVRRRVTDSRQRGSIGLNALLFSVRQCENVKMIPTSSLPSFCPRCGRSDLRPSMQLGTVDGIMNALMLTPFRCNSCNHRFFRYRRDWARIVVPLSLCFVVLLGVVAVFNVKPVWQRVNRAMRLPPTEQPQPQPRIIQVPGKMVR